MSEDRVQTDRLVESVRERLDETVARLQRAPLARRVGRVTRSIGLKIESIGPRVAVGEECWLEKPDGERISRCEVIGFDAERVHCMPLDEVRGLRVGDRIVATGRPSRIPVGPALLGRVLDATGTPIDDERPLRTRTLRPVTSARVPPMKRPLIQQPMATGIRAIDGTLTLGRGQRVGIFAGAGVGKSRLLGAIARHAADDVVVLALVGERSREVREFIDRELAGPARERTVVFVATSDEAPVRRVHCALAAATAAEAFSDAGLNVTLMMDSVTRVAMALREIGLSAGEPPSSKGYPPSVFSFLPKLLERAGTRDEGGAITGIYTVFVEGDDLNDPIADAARSILDGHLVLSRELAEAGHYPAIDVLASVSRVMDHVATDEQRAACRTIRRLLATYRDNRDLVSIGAYKPGADPLLDAAVKARPALDGFLRQDLEQPSSLEDTIGQIAEFGRQEGS